MDRIWQHLTQLTLHLTNLLQMMLMIIMLMIFVLNCGILKRVLTFLVIIDLQDSTGATGWSFSNGNSPSSEWSIANDKLSVSDTSRTNDAIASQQLFSQAIKEGRYLVTVDYSVSSGDFDIGIGNNRLFGIANT